MDSQIVRVEAKLACLDGKLLERVDLFTSLPLESMTLASGLGSNLSSPADFAKAQARCAQRWKLRTRFSCKTSSSSSRPSRI